MEENDLKRRSNYLCEEEPITTFLITNNIDRNAPPVQLDLNFDGCVSYKWALYRFKKCKCVEVSSFIPYELHKAPRCQNATYFNVTMLLENVLCSANLEKNFKKRRSIEDICRSIFSCRYRIYKSSSSFGTWPMISHIQNFVHSVMEPEYIERTRHGLLLPAWKNVLDTAANKHSMMVNDEAHFLRLKLG